MNFVKRTTLLPTILIKIGGQGLIPLTKSVDRKGVPNLQFITSLVAFYETFRPVRLI
jgi:hypothetical protein